MTRRLFRRLNGDVQFWEENGKFHCWIHEMPQTGDDRVTVYRDDKGQVVLISCPFCETDWKVGQ